MTDTTTVKVSLATRDELKSLAERDGITLDAALRRLLRLERQRQMGVDLASRGPNEGESAWVEVASQAVVRASR